MKSPRLSTLSNAQIKELSSSGEDGSSSEWRHNDLKAIGKDEAQRFPTESVFPDKDANDLDRELALRFEKLKASWASLEKERAVRPFREGIDKEPQDMQTRRTENEFIFRNPFVQGNRLLLEVHEDSLPADLAARFQALQRAIYTFPSTPAPATSPAQATMNDLKTISDRATVSIAAVPSVASASASSFPALASALRLETTATETAVAKTKRSASIPVSASSSLPPSSGSGFSVSSPSSCASSAPASSLKHVKHHHFDLSSNLKTAASGHAHSRKTSSDLENTKSSKTRTKKEAKQNVLLFSLSDVEELLESFTEEIVSKKREKLKEAEFLHRLITSKDPLTFWCKELDATPPASAGEKPWKEVAQHLTESSVSHHLESWKEDSDPGEDSHSFSNKHGLKAKSLKRWNFI
ncbi:hypothetical protein O6H91_04G087700 [Diphasiastrum complanatum]|uniref:Uncharacterized protein n=1 Tax=Diphasiastrum complanatum TaxID=34168 RepID=A0ACC2DZ65_DIPCM|nr:hypothetical protein O6H91_04G087700 [Diphasiastrum complanatum]